MQAELFDFVDQLTLQIRQRKIKLSRKVAAKATILTFCESFFDQFFADIGHTITGFTYSSKRAAAEIAERMGPALTPEQAAEARLIVKYEDFCDIAADVNGGYGGDASVTYQAFGRFIIELLERASEWAESRSDTALRDRINTCRTAFTTAFSANQGHR